MSVETIFQIANSTALAGWAALLASPFIPRLSQWIAAVAIPALLSVAYAGLVLAFWANADGGFGSLADVGALFRTPELLLAGWIHYLAFDLLVGAWIVRSAKAEGVPFLLAVPALALTFLFGPAGFLTYSALRFTRRFGRATAGA